ncbi:hypothetical protein RJ640_001335, partial [Escallonia rubra]
MKWVLMVVVGSGSGGGHALFTDLKPISFARVPDIGEGMRDTLHGYIEARGINENLFPFLQAWLYVKDHRQLMQWFKSVGSFINRKQGSEAYQKTGTKNHVQDFALKGIQLRWENRAFLSTLTIFNMGVVMEQMMTVVLIVSAYATTILK